MASSAAPLGIVCALQAELATLGRKRRAFDVSLGRCAPVAVVLSGMGPARAARAAERLLEQGVKALASWGSAAALRADLPAGSLLLPEAVIAEDGVAYPVDPAWHARLLARLGGNERGDTRPIVESRSVLADADAKRALFARSGGIAADMESAAVARAAYHANIPFIALRAVSDTVSMTVPRHLSEAIDAFGRMPASKLLTAVVLRPRDWGRVAQLAWGFRDAMARLEAVAKELPLDLDAPGHELIGIDQFAQYGGCVSPRR